MFHNEKLCLMFFLDIGNKRKDELTWKENKIDETARQVSNTSLWSSDHKLDSICVFLTLWARQLQKWVVPESLNHSYGQKRTEKLLRQCRQWSFFHIWKNTTQYDWPPGLVWSYSTVDEHLAGDSLFCAFHASRQEPEVPQKQISFFYYFSIPLLTSSHASTIKTNKNQN